VLRAPRVLLVSRHRDRRGRPGATSSALRMASCSSTSTVSAPARTCPIPSSTPTSCVPPAVIAKATTVLRARRGRTAPD
jgi:hypothetical protein